MSLQRRWLRGQPIKAESAGPWLWFSIPVLASVFAIWQFWTPGIASQADMLIGIYRIAELHAGIEHGSLFPRMGPNLNFGYGAPLFQFYPPLASYLALPFYWLGAGLINSSKIVFSISLFLSALGSYLCAHRLFAERSAAIGASMLYVFAPYLLLVIYERGAAAESLALGLLPWLFWAMYETVHDPGWKWRIGGGVLIALLFLAHNISSLFFLPVLAGFGFICWGIAIVGDGKDAVHARYLNGVSPLGGIVLSFGIGLGLSAFYWLPAILESRYTQVEAVMLAGDAAVTANLIPAWQEWVQLKVGFDYWDDQRFRLAWWQVAISVAGTASLYWLAPRLRIFGGFFVVVLLGTWLAQLDVTAVLWETLPLVRFIQFPWRLLGVAAFCVAILGGCLVCTLRAQLGKVYAWGSMVILTATVALLATVHLSPSQSRLWANLADDDLGILDLFARGRAGFPLFFDYSPATLQIPSGELSLPSQHTDSRLAPLHSVPELQLEQFSAYYARFQVANDEPQMLHMHRLFFPGWQAFVDGEAVATGPGGPLGLVSAEIPPGNHAVEFRFGPTPLRTLANGWSALTLVALSTLYLGQKYLAHKEPWNRGRRPGRAWALTGGLILIPLIVAGLWYSFAYSDFYAARNIWGSKSELVPINADFDQQLQLLGYTVESDVWRAGDTVQLRLYWLNQSELPDLKVFLHLIVPDDSRRVAQFDSEPGLGYGPMSRWMPGELVDDRYVLVVDEDIPAGDYLLLMGVYHPQTLQNLAIHGDAPVLPGERLVLQQIRVTD